MNRQAHRPFSPRTPLLALTLTTLPVAAQCELEWQPGQPAPGPLGAIHAMATAANGDLFVGGRFSASASAVTHNVARFDGNDWHALGGGVDHTVEELILLPNGDLIAAGFFQTAGNTPANWIAGWNGIDWFALGGGLNGPVRDMALMANGDLVVVGDFTTAGGAPALHAAIWDGTSWTALGPGPLVAPAKAVTVLPNDNIVVGGWWAYQAPDLELWDGVSWNPLPGVAIGSLFGVEHLQAMPNGDVAIVAQFGNNEVFGIWDGTQASMIPSPFTFISDFAIDGNGDLLALGRSGNGLSPQVATFNGANWNIVGNSVAHHYTSMSLGPNGSIYLARDYAPNGEVGLSNVARLQSGQWMPLTVAPYIDGQSLLALPGGDALFGGTFHEIEGIAANNIARRTSTGWSALGQGVDGDVTAMALAPDGSVVVGGDFQNAGATPAAHVARWDGSSWSAVGAGLAGVVTHLAINDRGAIVAIVNGNDIMVFDGQAWTYTGTSGFLDAVAALGNGDFLLAGRFFQSVPSYTGMSCVRNGRVSPVQMFNDTHVTGMVEDGGGGVILTRTQNGIAIVEHFDGANVVALATDPNGWQVRDLALLPNGDLVGSAELPSLSRNVVRFDGSSWSMVPGSPRGAQDIAYGARGELFVAGHVADAGNVVSVGFARAIPPCPASALPSGSGCTGSAGPVALTATSPPWVGTTFEQSATGMTPLSIGLHAIGFQAVNAPLPLGAPGCSLLVSLDYAGTLTPQNGAVKALLTIPNDPALAAFQLLTQVVGVELDANLAVTQTTSSNALQVTIGVF